MKLRSSTVLTRTRKRLRPTFAALTAGTLLTLAFPAHANSYHEVSQGETLSEIAKRYSVRPDTLRELNQLDSIGDNTPLSRMLLQLPSASAQTSSAQKPHPASELKKRVPAPSPARYFSGTMTRTETYKIQAGDTFESIAAHFTRGNESTSPAEIRRENKSITTLKAGSQLRVPVKMTFGEASSGRTNSGTANSQASRASHNSPVPRPQSQASAQVRPPAASSSSSSSTRAKSTNTPTVTRAITPADRGDIQVGSSSSLPVARAIPTSGTPSYRPPNPPAAQKSRGNLSARGGYGSMVDGGRVLQNGETLSTASGTAAKTTAVSSPKNLAKVAKISQQGAQIRRLPQAGAVTLYKCAPGTEIAVLKQEGEWSAVLMSDRSTGWLPTRYLQFTGTSVDITSQVVPRTAPADDSFQGWKGGYESNHPAIRHALSWLGTPYRYGGQSNKGIDCSSLMQKSFAAAGKTLPRVSRDQAKVGTPVAPENLQPGDRLYFSSSGTHVDHTGLYMGNDLFVHASGGARKVVVSRLSDKRNWSIFVNARR